MARSLNFGGGMVFAMPACYVQRTELSMPATQSSLYVFNFIARAIDATHGDRVEAWGRVRVNAQHGGDVMSSHIEVGKNRIEFSFRVLYWWEEQEIKRDSLVLNAATNRRTHDQPKFERGILNAALLRVDERTRDLLGDKRWSDVLPFRVVPPMHAVYEKMTGLPREDLLRFREDVKAYYDPEKRNSAEYVTPPELLEFIMLDRVGTITREELRRLSYSEFLKLHTIINFVSGRNGEPPTDASGDRLPGIPVGVRGTPGKMSPDAARVLLDQKAIAGP